MARRWQFWIDRGGTFTDCLALPPDGSSLRVTKVLSSDRAPLVGIRELLGGGMGAAAGRAAASQGTMNNLTFGNDRFGYYETIAGSVGAGPGFAGASAVHTHMTNTRITDPEVLETRAPVRLRRFSVRRGSGGAGRWPGGDGVVGARGLNLHNGRDVGGKASFRAAAGDVIRIETPGGGGFGSPPGKP